MKENLNVLENKHFLQMSWQMQASSFLRFFPKQFGSFQVIFNIMAPISVATYTAMAVIYPISNYTGTRYCYFFIYGLLWVDMFGQCLSFFLTIFRYICLYQENKLLSLRITPKVNIGTILQGQCQRKTQIAPINFVRLRTDL